MYFFHSGSSSPMSNSFQPWYARRRTTSGWLRPTCRSACGPERRSEVRGHVGSEGGACRLTWSADATSLTGSSLAFRALRTGTMFSSSPGGRVWESCNRKSDGSPEAQQPMTEGQYFKGVGWSRRPHFLFHNKSMEIPRRNPVWSEQVRSPAHKGVKDKLS